jgi:hypothetical protein
MLLLATLYEKIILQRFVNIIHGHEIINHGTTFVNKSKTKK